jgi:uncharacterized membrane-anchored protein YhcB (DUF1043 family)
MLKQIKLDLQREIKRVKSELEEHQKNGLATHFGIAYHKGMIEAYERTLSEVNQYIKQSK